MAIHQEEPGKQGGAPAADTNGRNNGQPQNERAAQAPPPSVLNINSRLSRPIERASTGELVKNYLKAFSKDAENSFSSSTSNVAEDFKLIVLDSSSDQVAVSAILVCYTQVYQAKKYVGVFPLIVEGSGQAPLKSSRFEPIGGKQVEIDIATGDAFNKTMWDRIEQKVASNFGADAKAINAGAMVLPVELKHDDTEHVHRVFYSATAALFTIMDSILGQQQAPFSASWIEKDLQKTANLDYAPLPIDDATGLPVRSDLNVTMRLTRGERGNDLHDAARNLTTVDCYIDLVFGKPDPIQVGFAQMPGTQSYWPRAVITRADTQVDALTPELHLLAISTISLLYHQDAWKSAFLPRYGDSGVAELRDLGAIGYEVNFTGDVNATKLERIDTRPEVFKNQDLLKLINTVIRPHLIISMDVAERGEQSWLEGLYLRAADNDPDAIGTITQAADNLTDGYFTKIFNSKPNIGLLRNDNNRIHLGYWKDRNGNIRDIRDFDYLAVLNRLASVDPQAPIDWSATYDAVEYPLEIRLENRMRMLRGLSNMTFQLKGWARRITWHREAIAALNEACAAVGLVARPSNINHDLMGSASRVQYDASSVAYQGGSLGNNSMFSYDSTQGARGYSGIAQPFLSRWQR